MKEILKPIIKYIEESDIKIGADNKYFNSKKYSNNYNGKIIISDTTIASFSNIIFNNVSSLYYYFTTYIMM